MRSFESIGPSRGSILPGAPRTRGTGSRAAAGTDGSVVVEDVPPSRCVGSLAIDVQEGRSRSAIWMRDLAHVSPTLARRYSSRCGCPAHARGASSRCCPGCQRSRFRCRAGYTGGRAHLPARQQQRRGIGVRHSRPPPAQLHPRTTGAGTGTHSCPSESASVHPLYSGPTAHPPRLAAPRARHRSATTPSSLEHALTGPLGSCP
jgi:hypothetical protein